MSRSVELVIKAKNGLAAGISKATAGLKKFGAGVGKIGRSAGHAFKRLGQGVLVVGAALVGAGVRAERFNKQMAQVATLTDMNMGKAKKAVRGLSAEFGLAKEGLTKGLYDALSAGVPKDNALDFLRTAAKAAVAGAGTTAEAVDILTTSMNAFKLPASEAERTADTLFATIKLGKTTLPELAASFAQVGPLAAASGVKFEEVSAAVATITKQGTPTAQAMTQIRAAIIALNKNLGDGWSKTMTLQEGMKKMAAAAGGSATKLKEMTGRIEGSLAIMQTTGKNAAMAAADLDEVTKSAGGMTDAFEKADKANVLGKLWQSLDNMVLTAGDAALKSLGPLIQAAADAAKNFGEQVATWMKGEKFAAMAKSVKEIVNAMKSSEGRGDVLSKFTSDLKSAVVYGADAIKAAGVYVGDYIANKMKGPIDKFLRKASPVYDIYKRIKGSTSSSETSGEKFARKMKVAGENFKAATAESAKIFSDANKKRAAQEKLGSAGTGIKAFLSDPLGFFKGKASGGAQGGGGAPPPIDTVADAERTAKAKADIAKKLVDKKIALEEELRDAERAAASERLNELKTQQAENERVARMSVKAYMANLRSGGSDQGAQDQARAERLKSRGAGGSSKWARDFIASADAIKKAQEGRSALDSQIAAAEETLRNLDQDRNKSLVDIQAELAGVRADITKIMRAG